jgi:tight adherence protein C
MWLIAVLIMASFLALGMALFSLRNLAPARERLARLADGNRGRTSSGLSVLRQPNPGRPARWLGRLVTPPKGKEGERLRERLVHAGFRNPGAPLTYTGIRIASAISIPLLIGAVPAVWTFAANQRLVLLLLAVGTAYVLPSYLLDRRIKRRRLEITNGLPDALDLLVVCVEAGLGVVAGLQRVSRELVRSSPVLCSEIELSMHEIRAGKTTSEGLRGLAARTGVNELSALAAMLIQTERFGTSVADTLRIHADALRSRRIQRAEELANKAPLKMLFPTVLIFLASLIVTMGPAMGEIMVVLRSQQ